MGDILKYLQGGQNPQPKTALSLAGSLDSSTISQPDVPAAVGPQPATPPDIAPAWTKPAPAVRVALASGGRVTPEQAAEARRIADLIGVSPNVSLEDSQWAREEYQARQIEAASPGLSSWAAQSAPNAAMAKEEPDLLGEIWESAKGVAKAPLSFGPKVAGTFGSLGWDTTGYLWGLVEALNSAAGFERGEAYARASREFAQEESRTIGRFMADERRNARQGLSWYNPEQLAYDTVGTLASMAPTVAVTAATGGGAVVPATLGRLGVGAAVAGVQSGTAQYTELSSEAGSEGPVRNLANLMAGANQGLVTGMLEGISLGKIFGVVPPALRGRVMDVIETGATEATTELLEQPTGALLGGLARGDDAGTIMDDIISAGTDLRVVPGAFLAGGGLRYGAIHLEARQARTFVKQQQALNDKITSSRLYQTSPEMMTDLLNASGEAMTQLVTLPKAALSEEAQAALGLDGASGDTISVPMSVLHARLSPETFKEVIPLAAPVEGNSLVVAKRRYEKLLGKAVGQVVEARDSERAIIAEAALTDAAQANEDLRARLRVETETLRAQTGAQPSVGETASTPPADRGFAYAEAKAVETFFQTAAEKNPDLDVDVLRDGLLESLGVTPDQYIDALNNNGELELDLENLSQAADSVLWDDFVGIMESQPVEISRELQADLAAMPPVRPQPLDRAGADVSAATKAQTAARLQAAGRTAAQANREAELLARFASIRSRFTGENPNTLINDVLNFGKDAKGDGSTTRLFQPADISSLTPEENISRGREAMDKVIAEQTDVLDAMYRPEVGGISFYWGKPGKESKKYGDGHGVSHLIARRGLEGEDGEAAARNMVDVLASGEIGEAYGPEKALRRNVTYAGHTAVLSLYKFGEKETWLLTGWKDYPIDGPGTKNEAPNAQEGIYNPQGYTPHPSGSRDGVAGASENNIAPSGVDGKPLFQGQGRNYRGRTDIMDDGSINIIFTEAQNSSTAVHEFAHAFRALIKQTMDLPQEQIADQAAFDEMKAGWVSVEAWLGRFDDDANLKAEYEKYPHPSFQGRAFDSLSKEEKDEYRSIAREEYFARGFEAYLMEGKAPTAGVKGLFQRMKAALLRVYEAVKENLNVELNDDVRQFFDRLLVTEEELLVDVIRSEAGPTPDQLEMMREADPEGVAEYEAAMAKAMNESEEAIVNQRMAERSKMLKAWRKEGKQFAKEDGRIQRVEEIKRQGGISRQSLEDLGYDDEAVRQFINMFPAMVSTTGAIGLDLYTDQFGFETADDLWNALLKTPTIDQIADQYVAAQEAEWAEWFDADREITDAELTAMEMEQNLWAKHMASKGSKSAPKPAKGLRAVIENQFNGLTMDEIQRANSENLKEQLKAEARASRAGYKAGVEEGTTAGLMAGAREGTIRGRHEERQRSKAALARAKAEGRQNLDWKVAEARAQALAARQELATRFKVQTQIKKEMAAFQAKARRLMRQGELGYFENKGLDPEYHSQIMAVLGMFGLGDGSAPGSPTLAAFIADADARGEYPVVADWIIQGDLPRWENGSRKDKPKSWKALTYDQFRDLADAVGSLAHLGRARRTMVVDGRKWNIENLGQAFDKNVRDNIEVDEERSPGRIIRETSQERSLLSRAAQGVRDAFVTLLKIETITQRLDGGKLDGLSSKAIYAPLRQAWETLSKLTESVTESLAKIATETIGDKALRKMSGEKIYDRRLPASLRGITREQLLVLVMNSGNAKNKAALMGTELEDGSPLTDRDIQAAREILTDQELAYVQRVWNFLNNTMYPQLNALQRRSLGVDLKKEPAEAFSVRGVMYTGGYFPLVFDPRISTRSERVQERQSNQDLARGNFVRPSVRAGATRERKGATYKDLFPQLNLGVLSSSLRDNIRDLAYRESLRDVQKLISRPEVRGAIVGGLGQEFYNEIPLWLQDIADKGGGTNASPIKVVKFFRNNVSLMSMGIKMSVVFAQVSGFPQSVQKLGGGYFLRGLKNQYARIDLKAAYNSVLDMSYEMRKRNSTSHDQDLSDALTAKSMFFRDLKEKYGELIMKPISFLDQLLANAVWQGAYIKGLEEGRAHDAAVYYADALVRATQPTGRDIDRSRTMRGGLYGAFKNADAREAGRLVTMFGTFFSGTVNVGWETAMGVKADLRKKKYGKATADTVWGVMNLLVFPALIEALIKGGIPTDEDEFEEYLIDVGKGSASLAVAGFPMVRDLFSFFSGSSPRYNITPLTSPVEAVDRLKRQTTKDEINPMALTRTAASAVGAFTGLPAGQINTTLTGIEEWDQADSDLGAVYRLFVRRPYDAGKK